MSWSWTPAAGSSRGCSAWPFFDVAEMARTRREIVDKLFTFLWNMEEPELAVLRDHRRDETSNWHRPKEDSGLKKQMDVLASGAVESGVRPGTTDGRMPS